MNPRMTSADIFAHDLHKAALRTAAFVVIARHFGAWAHGQLLLSGTPSDSMEHSMVFGRTRLDHGELNEHQRKIVGLADAIADYIKDDPDATGMMVAEYLDMDGLEGGIVKMVGTYTEADLDECIGVLRELWEPICTEAESLERAFQAG